MIKFFKEKYYKWRQKGKVAQKEVYVVCLRNDKELITKVFSMHSSLKGAMDAREKNSNEFAWKDCSILVERYGLWD